MEIKMKPEEAYNLIELCLDYDKDMSDYPERYEMALQVARDVFHKQTPVKPMSNQGEYTCPMCELTIAEGDEYCWHCGQKLDWDE